jgi:hypothetical protein
VAKELHLDWDSVKTLEKQYMPAQLRRAGTPAPRAIGIDEISIRKGHTYRIVVSDLDRMRAIWFGGKDRSEASTDEFFTWLGVKICLQRSCSISVVVPVFNSNARMARLLRPGGKLFLTTLLGSGPSPPSFAIQPTTSLMLGTVFCGMGLRLIKQESAFH